MIRHGDLYNMHQQARFIRPDAARYMRPDVSRWLRPPHPDERKYSPSQPRDERGRRTDVGGGEFNTISGSPMGQINLGDLPTFIDLFWLFQITPNDGAFDGVQLAGDNGKPLLDSFGEPYYAKGGHHELPQSIFGKWDLPEETRRVFDQRVRAPCQKGELT
ncbi:hypothetical protein CSIRO_2374 [Bradyrhizobiaceae bacterium SG-6C]|nr:hypothetical protein CSIRO_2374 [Bradyrhizobiaceae bacterium SG-6C]